DFASPRQGTHRYPDYRARDLHRSRSAPDWLGRSFGPRTHGRSGGTWAGRDRRTARDRRFLPSRWLTAVLLALALLRRGHFCLGLRARLWRRTDHVIDIFQKTPNTRGVGAEIVRAHT